MFLTRPREMSSWGETVILSNYEEKELFSMSSLYDVIPCEAAKNIKASSLRKEHIIPCVSWQRRGEEQVKHENML